MLKTKKINVLYGVQPDILNRVQLNPVNKNQAKTRNVYKKFPKQLILTEHFLFIQSNNRKNNISISVFSSESKTLCHINTSKQIITIIKF